MELNRAVVAGLIFLSASICASAGQAVAQHKEDLEGPEIWVHQDNDGVVVGVKYTATHLSEFLWGVTRPFHLWNTEPSDDEEKIIHLVPFWSRPLKPGGLISWLMPKAWEENAGLTGGAFVTELAIAVAIAASDND